MSKPSDKALQAAAEAWCGPGAIRALENNLLSRTDKSVVTRIALALDAFAEEARKEERERCAEIARNAENTHRGTESIALEIEAGDAEAICGLCGWRGQKRHIHTCDARGGKST